MIDKKRKKQFVAEFSCFLTDLCNDYYMNGHDDGYADGLKDKNMDLPVSWDDAYKRGYEDGKADTPFTDTEEAEKKAYQKGYIDGVNQMVKELKAERQTGEWIGVSPFVDTLMCSECGENIISADFKSNFCPHCGADMRAEKPHSLLDAYSKMMSEQEEQTEDDFLKTCIENFAEKHNCTLEVIGEYALQMWEQMRKESE